MTKLICNAIRIKCMEIGQKIELTIFIGMSPFLLMFSQFLFPYFYTKGIDYIQMGMLSAAYSFTCIIVLVTVGTVADLRGRKLTLSFFGICSSIFPILYIIFDNFVSFLALRTLESIKEPITVIRRAVL